MDVEILARVQFAVTIMFHYIYPPLSIGLGFIMVILEGMYLKNRSPLYKKAAQFWTKIFALTFAFGVATGIVMEFEFGTNWASYSKFVGDVFGSALAAEGVFAFFLESGFLAIVLFGWSRVTPVFHFFSTCMVYLGSVFSAVWIVVANSWMQTPQGYQIVEHQGFPRAQIVDFWQMVFNPSSVDRLIHTLLGAHLAATFLVVSIAAYYILKKKHLDFARLNLKLAIGVSFVILILQAISGDRGGKIVAKYQPMKLAAFEGLFDTTTKAPLLLFGIPNPEKEKTEYAVGVPGLLSYLAYDNVDAEVKGLKEFPKKDWPKTRVLFFVYRLMLGMWGLMLIVCLWGFYLWYRGRLENSRAFLWFSAFSVFFPQLANQAGWVSAEMGRYPWIVYNLLRISEGLSKKVTAGQVLSSLIMFTIIYFLLFIVFIYMLDKKIKHGPVEGDYALPYHQVKKVVSDDSSIDQEI